MIDYAQFKQLDSWLRHPFIGEPSFDTCVRDSANPIHRGEPGLEWPVNGSLMEDPVSGNWFAYVGRYPQGYGGGRDLTQLSPMDCIVYQSNDRGQSWKRLGPVFADTPFHFADDPFSVRHAPDVVVVYHDGKYHMIYDWCAQKADWPTMTHPDAAKGQDSGIAYASSDKPQGPFIRHNQPVLRTSQQTPILGKYKRAYAASLVRRKDDWLILFSMDDMAHLSWAWFGMTAKDPAGPWSAPKLLASPDTDQFYASPVEYFPAFVQEGFVYHIGNALAANRNFQVVYRASLEETMDPAAWKIHQYGSFFHGQPRENEAQGLWGQSPACFVDKEQTLHFLYPSKTRDDLGTINLASRPWNKPFREQGFYVSGSSGSSLTCLQNHYQQFQLEADLTVEGEKEGKATLFWHHAGVVGPSKPWVPEPHPLFSRNYTGLELSKDSWTLLQVDAQGQRKQLATGTLLPAPPAGAAGGAGKDSGKAREHQLVVQVEAAGQTRVQLDGRQIWQGALPPAQGVTGLLASSFTTVTVNRFAVGGAILRRGLTLLYTDVLVQGAQAAGDWNELSGDAGASFRFGVGAISKPEFASPRAKWNFIGTACTLWGPTGPQYGWAEVLLDGKPAGRVDFHSEKPGNARAMLRLGNLPPGYHAVVLRGHDRPIPMDSADIEP